MPKLFQEDQASSRRFPERVNIVSESKHDFWPGFHVRLFHSIRSHVPQIIPKSCCRTRRFLARGRQGCGASVPTSMPHQGFFPPFRAPASARRARWWPPMVGWKPLLSVRAMRTHGTFHRTSRATSTCLCVPPSSLRVPPAFSSSSKPGTPRNRLHSAALPANQIAHSRDLAAVYVSPDYNPYPNAELLTFNENHDLDRIVIALYLEIRWKSASD